MGAIPSRGCEGKGEQRKDVLLTNRDDDRERKISKSLAIYEGGESFILQQEANGNVCVCVCV